MSDLYLNVQINDSGGREKKTFVVHIEVGISAKLTIWFYIGVDNFSTTNSVITLRKNAETQAQI